MPASAADAECERGEQRDVRAARGNQVAEPRRAEVVVEIAWERGVLAEDHSAEQSGLRVAGGRGERALSACARAVDDARDAAAARAGSLDRAGEKRRVGLAGGCDEVRRLELAFDVEDLADVRR